MYTYDESIWEPSLMIDAGTAFDELGEEFYCPMCAGEKEYFAELQEEINYALNPENLTALESEHWPIIIDRQDDWVKIQIWEKIHESHEEHYISSVVLFDEYNDIIDEIILLSSQEAIVECDVDVDEIYEIRVHCVTHGIWARKFAHD